MEERPALVLIDINLPGDTGWSVLRTPAMWAADAPPAVVVSAGTVNPRRLRESGAAGYLPKPLPLETLLGMVHRFAEDLERLLPDVELHLIGGGGASEVGALV